MRRTPGVTRFELKRITPGESGFFLIPAGQVMKTMALSNREPVDDAMEPGIPFPPGAVAVHGYRVVLPRKLRPW